MAAPVIASLASAGDQLGNFTVSKPTGTAAGNLLVAAHLCSNGSNLPAAPTGFNTHSTTGLASGFSLSWFYRLADGSEGSSFTFNSPSGLDNASAYLFRITGADVAPRAGSNANSGTGTTASSNAYTIVANDLVLVAFGNVGSGTFSAPDNGFTDQTDVGTVYSLDVASGTPAGSGGQPAESMTVSASLAWIALLVLVPAAAAYDPSTFPVVGYQMPGREPTRAIPY